MYDNIITFLLDGSCYYNTDFKKLPKLSIKDIQKYNEPYKMALLFFYGYYSMYKKYELVDLNRYINKCIRIDLFLLMATCGNIKEIKYLVSKGINIHKCYSSGVNAYLITVNSGNIKLMKYFESIGVNIHKKTIFGNNAYLIATYKGNIRLMKHLEKKGINIYLRNSSGYNYMDKDWHKYNKIGPYVFKNMNYKLNRFKMCFIANNIFGPRKIDFI